MKILVSGATGLVGRTLCRMLLRNGCEVVALTRRPELASFPPGIQAFGWSPEAGPLSERAVDGVDGVIHLAGEPVDAARWTEEQKQRIRDSRVLGTRNLVAGIRRVARRPTVLVSASAIGYYGERGDEILSESSSQGTGFLSETCREWESEAAQARELGLRVAQIRVGVVLSPEGGALKRMLTPFRFGLGGRLGTGKQWFPWIHVEDIAGIFQHTLMTPIANGPINGVAPGIVVNEEFTRELASALHRPAIFPVPQVALKVLLGELSTAVVASLRVVPKAALEVGYEFQFPRLPQALEDLVRTGEGMR